MNLADPPINNPELLLLHLWKIIDLPSISLKNLLFKISYNLFLLPPDKAIEFINSSIKKKLLIETEKNHLTLSNSLKAELKDWQKRRNNEIKQNINSVKKVHQIKTAMEKGKSTGFSGHLKSLVEKGTLNRAAKITNEAFVIKELDFKGIIKATVSGSKEDPYIIEMDINNKCLKHDCHDFEARRSKSTQFCKHLTKFFLLLRESHKASTEQLLKSLSENLEKWNFIS
ncbi:MAG: hypothetical protein ACXAC5_23595 [Promethearchaeota archaeon]|jgi:hypothetical protein